VTQAFVDSGAWIALAIPQDSDHERATRLFESLEPGTRLLTSNYVLSETYTWIRYHDVHSTAVALHRRVEQARRELLLRVAWVDEEVHQEAWRIFERYRDQRFSLCDCTSFVLARRAGVDFVFGFDSDFFVMNFDVRPAP